MSAATASAAHGDIRDLLLDTASLSLDQLPMLPVIFDRVGTHLVERFRHIAASPPHFTVNAIESTRIGEVLDAYELNAIAGVFRIPNWDSQIIVGFDRDFMFTMIEALFGGEPSEPPVDDERGFSNIEGHIAQFLFEQVAQAIQSAFSLVTDIRVKFERSETRMDFAVIGRRNNPAVAARFLLQAMNRGGQMFVVIPQSALGRVRQALSRVVSGDTAQRDPAWIRQISDEVQKTEVSIRAVLEAPDVTLGDIANLKVGQVIKLQATPRSRIRVESNDQPLFWSYLGQAEGFHTLCIDEVVDQEQEFVNDVLSR
jgi:flagellar motor switch protein FliM